MVASRSQHVRRLLQAVERIEERMFGQGEAFLHGLGKPLPPVAARQLGRGEARLGGGEQHLDPIEFRIDLVPPVAPPVQPVPVEKRVPKRLPVLLPLGPHHLEFAPPRRLPLLDRFRKRLAAPHLGNAGTAARGPFGQLARQEPALERMAHQQDRGRIQPAAPEVPDRRGDHSRIAAAHLEAEGKPALEGEIGERPLAETVDRADARPVDVVQGGFEAPGRLPEIDTVLPLPCRDQLQRL